MNKLVRVLVFLGALLLVVAAMALLGTRSGDRSKLQQYQAELRAKGEKLTLAELTRGRQPSAVDSHALITNAVAKLSGARITPGLLELRKYIGPGQASVTWRQASPSWTQPAGIGGRGSWEELAAQMQGAQGALQEIRAALQNSAADAGPATSMWVARPIKFAAIRIAAQWLMGAAESELHQGRLEEGLQDLEALTALARMERDEYTMVAQMIRCAVAGLGLGVTWEALQAPGWTEPQLARLQAAWAPVDLLEAVEKGLVGERDGGGELFDVVRHSSGRQTMRLLSAGWNTDPSSSKVTFNELALAYLYFPAYKLTSIDADELFYLTSMQESIAALRLAKAQRPWPETKAALLKAGARVGTVAGTPAKIRYFMSLMSLPKFMRGGERAVEGETERQMMLAAIALKRSQLRHNQLPASLEALVPEFLPMVPYDYMGAKPLGYRLKVDGSYVLYSIGEDGKDDGGDPTPPPGTPTSLWSGRDAVWPSPATESNNPTR